MLFISGKYFDLNSFVCLILDTGKLADELGNLLLSRVDAGGVDLLLLQLTEDAGELGPDDVPLLAQPDGPHHRLPV